MKKQHYSPAMRVFQFFATFLFILVLLFTTLSLCTSKRSLKSLCNQYVRAVDLNEEYFGNFVDAGFTKDETREFLTDDRVYTLISGVMSDRMLAIFRYSDAFDYSLDSCKEEISTILMEYNEKYKNKLSEKKISSLTDYTCDISGITSMFLYDTPLAYRNALFQTEDLEDIRLDTKILQGVSVLSSWYFLLAIGFMYIFVLGIMFFLHKKEEKVYPIMANTILHPSILFFALSIGERLGLLDEPLVTDYIFLRLMIVSGIGVVVGSILYFVIRKFNKGK